VKTLIRAAFVIGFENGGHVIHHPGVVVYENERIRFVGRDYPGPVDETRDAGLALVSPGFIDLDALADIDHALIDSWHGPGTADGLQWSEDYFRHRRHDVFSPAEVAFRREFALVQLIRNGITTAMPIAAETHNAWAETYEDLAQMAAIAGRLGLRMYLGSSYRAGVHVVRDDGSRDVLWEPRLGEKGLADAVRFARDFQGAHAGLIRTCLLPCRIETMTPDLMRATARAAEELDCRVRIHAMQSKVEVALLRRWYGQTPLELLQSVDLLGPRLLTPHGIFIGGHTRNPEPYRGEIEALAAAGATVVHCPLTSVRYAMGLESFDRFRTAGVNLALGTDSFPPDMIRVMDAGSSLAKLVEGRVDAGRAADLFNAATLGGAAALGRTDLGRLAPGALADLIIVDLSDPRVGPVDDPIRTLLMNCTGANVRGAVINGRTVLQDGRLPGLDADALRSRAQHYLAAMKAAYSERDVQRRTTDALFPPSFPIAADPPSSGRI
jgi:8-oxoguanine deaminase